MAKKRFIDTKFWDDSYIIELQPLEKFLFLYFLTNPLTDICGIYEIPIQRISFDTGIDKSEITKILNKFSKDKKVFYINGWIYIKNFTKHQLDNPSIKQGIIRSKSIVPKEIINEIENIIQTGDRLGTECDLPILKPIPIPKPKLKDIADKSAKEFSSKSYIETLINDKQRHIHIIGLLFSYKELKFDNQAQVQAQMKRLFRPAKSLEGYPDDRILETMKVLDKESLQDKKYVWGLETILKRIDIIN